MTLRPSEHFRIACEEFPDKGFLDPDDEYRCRALAIGKLWTKAIKRIRKNTGARFRYLSVFERHKSGLPHMHFMLHERDAFHGVTKRQIQSEWPHGFSNVRLIEDSGSAIRYVCKYISKDAVCRIRASLKYGS